jgi:hypothetical protein
MVNNQQPPSRPPPPPARPAPPPQHQPSRVGGDPSQPLQPPLPPATSAPPRQPPPNPTPHPDEPEHDQRWPQGASGVDREALTPEQRTGLVTEPHPPQKFKRPLPQPGDPDYVAGQPVNEEEAARMEQVEEDRYQFAIQAGKDAEARRMDARSDEQEGEQYAGTPGKKQPDDGKPLHKPGDHGDSKR